MMYFEIVIMQMMDFGNVVIGMMDCEEIITNILIKPCENDCFGIITRSPILIVNEL